MAAIRESAQGELVFIGTAEKHLQFAIGKRIRQPRKFYGGAEKAVIECGQRLEVSWATTPTPEAHKAALVLAYEEQHVRRPGFECHGTGKRILGVKRFTRKYGEAYDELMWSDWMPMIDSTIPRIPEELGVYRVRAVSAPYVSSTELQPKEVVDKVDDLERIRIEDFILEVPRWRDKYLKSNMSTFKVEAFIQKDWDSQYLGDPSYKDRYRWVEDRIRELEGKQDLINPEDDMEIVYRWGGGRGPNLFAQIKKNNSIDEIQKQIRIAFDALEKEQQVRALEELKRLKYCSDAFGSKVLAMRSPKNAPIWDNIAQHCLREFTIGGKKVRSYEQFIEFCEHVAEELHRAEHTAPRGEGRWYLRDIEMGIFQFGWDNGKFNGRITGELP